VIPVSISYSRVGLAVTPHETDPSEERAPGAVPERQPLEGLRPPAPEGLATLEEVELRHVANVLRHCGGHRRRAARILGISERNLYRILKRLGGDRLD